MNTPITVEITINAPIQHAWECWTKPEHITKWAFASNDWEAPRATNDVREGGKFSTTMAAKDGSASFDFTGTYTAVELHRQISYIMDDGRKVHITFTEIPNGVRIIETFDPENENSEEMQKSGWQAILTNFKTYTESQLAH